MKVRFAPLLAALAFALLQQSALGDPRVDEWIAKARAAVGPDAALDAVTSIHFMGTLETMERVPDKSTPGKYTEQPLRLAIDIVFQKPYQQRITLRSDKVVETTALDDYDAWVRRTDPSNPAAWRLSLLDAAQIKHLRANTWENLAFYRGIERNGGRVEYQGEEPVDGKPCVKLVFVHSESISFTRYFDKASGNLIKTVTENGSEIREEGELTVNGIHFPKKLLNKPADGSTSTITFDSIKVNEVIPASEFAVPSLLTR
jgi:hypothetical protein